MAPKYAPHPDAAGHVIDNGNHPIASALDAISNAVSGIGSMTAQRPADANATIASRYDAPTDLVRAGMGTFAPKKPRRPNPGVTADGYEK